MSNTYKFSSRDGKKHLTINGYFLDSEQEWGWYGRKTVATAGLILTYEYGTKTAQKYAWAFADKYLANITCDNFVLTSGAIAYILGTL